MIFRRNRTAATLGAALLFGVGGGAGAALAINTGGTTTTKVVTASGGTAPVASTSGALSVNDVYRSAKQGVVDITVQSGPGKAEGSGFVIDKTRDIVTNEHVVSGGGKITVKFADGTTASARVVGSDPSSDVAVIHVSRVDSSKLQPLSFGDSSKVQVGNGVVAIGSPYGLAGTVTVGVVSALGRTITSPNHFSIAGAIQTDAPINHGNSGGPLLDASGHVIGMNSQIESQNGENTGVGFAIASNSVRTVAEKIVSGGKVAHPFLGLSLSDGTGGALVGAVTSGSPASDAGVQQGDIVTAADGHAVSTANALIGLVQSHKPGDVITLTVRHGGSTHDLRVTLANRAS
jgi:putative serine protease PepD